MITSEQISVIIQGAYNPEITPKTIKSIKKLLPDSQIIFSTWENTVIPKEATENIQIVFNKDPGAYEFNAPSGKLHNINRLIYSTQKGIELAKRPYTLKLRSDMCLNNKNFLKLYKFKDRCCNYKLFTNRILVCDTFSLKFEENTQGQRHYRPFHISDWFYFGTTSDIQKLYDIPLVHEPEFTQWYKNHPMPENKFHMNPRLWRKMTPEQYITSTCAQKYFPQISFKDILDYNEHNIRQSEIFIANNFDIFSLHKLGISILKPEYMNFKISEYPVCKNGYYSEMVCKNDYNKYCRVSLKHKIVNYLLNKINLLPPPPPVEVIISFKHLFQIMGILSAINLQTFQFKENK